MKSKKALEFVIALILRRFNKLSYLIESIIYMFPLNSRTECTNVQDTLRRRIVIYLLCLLRAFSRKQRECQPLSANLPIDRRKKGRRNPPGVAGRGICGVTLKIQSENSVTCETAGRANVSKD